MRTASSTESRRALLSSAIRRIALWNSSSSDILAVGGGVCTAASYAEHNAALAISVLTCSTVAE